MSRKPKVEEIECGIFYEKPLIFRPKSHRYFFDGSPIPSVTTILGRLDKPALLGWAAERSIEAVKELVQPDENGNYLVHGELLERCKKAYERLREEAADIGKAVHKHAECVLNGEEPPHTEEPVTLRAISAFEEWRKTNKIVPISLERRVVSKRLFFAGTTDVYAVINGKLSILDFKTGKGIYDEYWLQTEAYALALEEETGEKIEERHIIRLDKKTGEFEAACKPCSQIHRDAFTALVTFDALVRRFKEAA